MYEMLGAAIQHHPTDYRRKRDELPRAFPAWVGGPNPPPRKEYLGATHHQNLKTG